jgi:hypothetical protein
MVSLLLKCWCDSKRTVDEVREFIVTCSIEQQHPVGIFTFESSLRLKHSQHVRCISIMRHPTTTSSIFTFEARATQTLSTITIASPLAYAASNNNIDMVSLVDAGCEIKHYHDIQRFSIGIMQHIITTSKWYFALWMLIRDSKTLSTNGGHHCRMQNNTQMS